MSIPPMTLSRQADVYKRQVFGFVPQDVTAVANPATASAKMIFFMVEILNIQFCVISKLSDRQIEVMRMLYDGKNDSEIAEKLFISCLLYTSRCV